MILELDPDDAARVGFVRLREVCISEPRQGRIVNACVGGVELPHRVHKWGGGGVSTPFVPAFGPEYVGRDFYYRSTHPPAAASSEGLLCEGLLCEGLLCEGWCRDRARREAAWGLAAKKIQRAVRHWLYNPDSGTGFRKAMSRFEAASSSTEEEL